MSIQGDLMGGSYSVEEVDKIFSMNRREKGTMKPNRAFYRKTMGEMDPTWADKRDLVTFLINESNISPISKNYLRECEDFIPHYQSKAAIFLALNIIFLALKNHFFF